MTHFNTVLNADLRKHWVCLDQKGEIIIRKKDNGFIRFFKISFNKICCRKDPYQEIRLNNIALVIFKKAQEDSTHIDRWLEILAKLQKDITSKYKAVLADTIGKVSSLRQAPPVAETKIPQPPPAWMDNILNSEFQFSIRNVYTDWKQEEFEKAYPLIRECNCKQVPASLRAFLEHHSVLAVEASFPNKNDPLDIVSVGPGYCFQELVYLITLLKLGYKNINLTLIEPGLNREGDSETIRKAIEQFKQFCSLHIVARHLDISLNIAVFEDLEAYKASQTKAQLLLIIDVQGETVGGGDIPNQADASVVYFTKNDLLQSKGIVAMTRNLHYHQPGIMSGLHIIISENHPDWPEQKVCSMVSRKAN